MRRLFTSVFTSACLTLWAGLIWNLQGESPASRLGPSLEATFQQATLYQPSEVEQLEASQAALQVKLEQPIRLEFIDAELFEIAEYLSQTREIQVTVDQRSFRRLDRDPQALLTVKLPEVRLRSALTLMLQSHDLTWYTADGVIHISPDANSDEVSAAHVIPCQRLMQSPHDPDRLDRESLPAALERHVSPESWDVNGGPGSVLVYQHAMIVQQTEPTIQEIGRLLAALEQAADDYQHDPRQALGRVYRWDDDMPAATHRFLQAQLTKTVPPMQFSETPLAGVVAWLAGQTGAPLYLDTRAKDALGNRLAATPVSVTLGEKPLRQVLIDLLVPLGLYFQPRHDVVYIDGGDQPQLMARIYPVRDLIDPQAAEEELFWKYTPGGESPLVTMISEAIPDMSAFESPDVSLTYLDSVDCLIVNASRQQHLELQKFLSHLRQVRGPIDYRQHARQLQAARQAPFWLGYLYTGFQAAKEDELALATEHLLGPAPPKMRSRLEITTAAEGLRIRATAAEHRKLKQLIQRSGLPLYPQEPNQDAPVFGGSIVPVVG